MKWLSTDQAVLLCEKTSNAYRASHPTPLSAPALVWRLRGDDVVQAAVANVVGPAIATDDPEAAAAEHVLPERALVRGRRGRRGRTRTCCGAVRTWNARGEQRVGKGGNVGGNRFRVRVHLYTDFRVLWREASPTRLLKAQVPSLVDVGLGQSNLRLNQVRGLAKLKRILNPPESLVKPF